MYDTTKCNLDSCVQWKKNSVHTLSGLLKSNFQLNLFLVILADVRWTCACWEQFWRSLKISRLLEKGLWMGLCMVFVWMPCAYPVRTATGSGRKGLLFQRASFLAFHQVEVLQGSFPCVSQQVWPLLLQPCVAGGDPAAASPGNKSSVECRYSHFSSALSLQMISVASLWVYQISYEMICIID